MCRWSHWQPMQAVIISFFIRKKGSAAIWRSRSAAHCLKWLFWVFFQRNLWRSARMPVSRTSERIFWFLNRRSVFPCWLLRIVCATFRNHLRKSLVSPYVPIMSVRMRDVFWMTRKLRRMSCWYIWMKDIMVIPSLLKWKTTSAFLPRSWPRLRMWFILPWQNMPATGIITQFWLQSRLKMWLSLILDICPAVWVCLFCMPPIWRRIMPQSKRLSRM